MSAVTAATADTANAADHDGDVWEPLPAFLPVDPREHEHVCVIASAIAAVTAIGASAEGFRTP